MQAGARPAACRRCGKIVKKNLLLPLLSLLFSNSLSALDGDSSSTDWKAASWHILFQGGTQSFMDEWMRTTYGLAPYVGCEFSKRVSPIIDGVVEMGFCIKNGTYLYDSGWNGYYLNANHYRITYAKMGLGLRACDRRLGEGSPFAELGFDAAHVRERSEDYSEDGSSLGTHVAVGYWCYIGKKWVVQAKGKFQLLAVSLQSQGPYARYYEIDLSGLELTVAVGFGK
jgi:hypothetical protein